jgi:hypothetical protein
MKIRNEVIYAAVFAVGAAVGSLATWKIVKTKYEKIAQEEIDSVKEVYTKKMIGEEIDLSLSVGIDPDEDNRTLEEKLKDLKIVTDEYTSIIQNQGYASNAVAPEPKKEVEKVVIDRPYVISPEEYGELGYEEIELTYYADEVLADDQNELVEDVDDIVGLDSLKRFGEFEDDSVHVRNDALHADYEILLDSRTYAEAKAKTSPHLVEAE